MTHADTSARSQVRWCRADDVLWRIGADRVLARVVGSDAVDLIGAAALVWVALDEPGTISEIRDRLADEDLNLEVPADLAVEAAVEMMQSSDLIRPDDRPDGRG